MTEEPLLLGSEVNLVGVRTLTDAPRSDYACLLFNAGVIHRVGPRRISVKLARALAKRGLPTLRIDLSGVGDSRVPAGATSFREQAVKDLQAAMHVMEQKTGAKKFLLFGICSGAVNAFWTALADERVVGIMMFDGFWYRTRWTEPVRRWKRLKALTLAELLRLGAGRVKRLLSSPLQAAQSQGIFEQAGDNANPPQHEFAAHLATLVARDVSVFFLYGGTVTEYFSYQRQFVDAFRGEPFLSRIRCELHPDLDHTVVALEVQQKLITLVSDWMIGCANGKREP